MNDALIGKVGRTVALLVAALAVVDPALTSNRGARAEISVVASTMHDSALTRLVAAKLSRSYSVLPVPFEGAAASVVVGNQIPANWALTRAPVFAVLPDSSRQNVAITRVDAPRIAAVDARVVVNASVHVIAVRGKKIELSLSANGSVVDRKTISADSVPANGAFPLTFVPAVPGAVTLRVAANVEGASTASKADVVTEVRARKWSVLFFDPRPSWMSTFVRRAVERDTRFAVTSRVVTSTNLSTDAGRPPAALYEAAVMELYDAIVVGAPESISARDAEGLDRFLRRRGGTVVLLFDDNKRGAYERFAPLGTFTSTSNAAGLVISDANTDSIALRATEWMWPDQLPAGAQVLAASMQGAPKTGAISSKRPLVWSVSAGAGRVIVSGALDSWKYRDESQSSFEKFWQQTIGEAANSAIAGVEIELPNTPQLPGTLVPIRVTSRTAALAEPQPGGATNSTMTVQLETPSGSKLIRVWPTASRGEFRGEFAAPSSPGAFVVSAVADGARDHAPLVVDSGASVASAHAREALSAWVAGKGGEVLPESRIDDIERVVDGKVASVERRSVWHPMRSWWWLVPFAAGLSLDWWLRRRRGLA